MTEHVATSNGHPTPDLDDLLREHFRAALPHPWPRFQPPVARRPAKVVSFWGGSRMRLALAASVALLLTGYLAVAGLFPRNDPAAGPGLDNATGVIGNRSKVRPIQVIPGPARDVTTPGGQGAKMLEETTNEDRPTIIINVLPLGNSKGGR